MTTFTVHSENKEQVNAIKAFMKALKIKFDVANNSYDEVFVDKIKESEKQFSEGRFKKIETKDLWK
jgi:inosine/xanthosine triphosphate pyrophosphatase family protein